MNHFLIFLLTISPKKSISKVINQEAPDLTDAGEATVATFGPTSTDQALTAANPVVSAAPVGTDAQGSAAASLMETNNPIITASQDIINGGVEFEA
ncbi:uncharacterized protein ATC70_003344 [Mucor velutinosus]|uniref:Uncharacterized protein n=1 Tax=Mucor velutinosus TaxID=708070 RepID=A0AAN7DDU2_9FUNG|nr:hypothetical protein ATC70_003344 [Mucor velutinosus]